jgi:hypothetical protein
VVVVVSVRTLAGLKLIAARTTNKPMNKRELLDIPRIIPKII